MNLRLLIMEDELFTLMLSVDSLKKSLFTKDSRPLVDTFMKLDLESRAEVFKALSHKLTGAKFECFWRACHSVDSEITSKAFQECLEDKACRDLITQYFK